MRVSELPEKPNSPPDFTTIRKEPLMQGNEHRGLLSYSIT